MLVHTFSRRFCVHTHTCTNTHTHTYTHIHVQTHIDKHACTQYRSHTTLYNTQNRSVLFIDPSPHGMMNASALETGSGFHRAYCTTFRRHKACYSFIVHRLSGPKQLCMNGLLKTTTPTATAGSRTLASRVRDQRSTDWAICAAISVLRYRTCKCGKFFPFVCNIKTN